MRLAAIGGANRLDQIGGAGAALIEGTVNEPTNVTVNGQAATVRALPGGEQFLFSKELALAAGTHEITVNAQDQANNTTLRRYNVTVGGTERTLTYDANGNLTEEAVADGSTRTYQCDSLNRLIAIQSDKIPVEGSWRTSFAYDGQSRRVGIVEQVRGTSGWTTESSARYLWEGTEIIQKRDATGSTVTARYYDQGEIRVSGSTTIPSYFTRDHLGSVREVVNQGGVIAQSFDYTAWGERTSSTAGSLEWGFTGHHYHEKSGLCLAMYRAYDANLGRWLSEDPIGSVASQMNARLFGTASLDYYLRGITDPEMLPFGPNLYGYVGGRPANDIDPEGEVAPLVVIGVGILAGIAFDYVIDKIKNRNLSEGSLCSEEGVPAAANAALGAGVAATGPFVGGKTGGVSGGGRSGQRTSVASQVNHRAASRAIARGANKGSAIAARRLTTSILRKVPYVGTGLGLLQLGDAIVNPTSCDE